ALMRAIPELRTESAECRSRTIAPPRAEARDSPQSADTRDNGESGGKLILTELRGSRPLSCPSAANAPSSNHATNLLRVDMIDRHLSRVRIDITRPDRSLRVHCQRHHPGVRMPHGQRLIVLLQLNAAVDGFEHDALNARR